MSIEHVKSFIEKMKTDKEFARKVASYKDAELRMTFIKEAGFDCTPAEMRGTVLELSDDDLQNVSGGIRPDHWA